MRAIILTLTVALVFYIVIPGVGAFLVRHRWRLFRRSIVESSMFPFVGSSLVRRSDNRESQGYLGCYRFFGSLEAIQGGNVIWIRRGNISLSVEMHRASLYMLPAYSAFEDEGRTEKNEESLADEAPRLLSWERIFSLPEGSRVFISGPLYGEKRHGVFRSNEERPLTVVLFDGREDTILRRAIWGGRQRNEYWNAFTPGSLAAGAFALLIQSYFLLLNPLARLEFLFSLSVCSLPFLTLLPPGMLLFLIYRKLWKRGRFLRAERDLLRLPLRYFSGGKSPEAGTMLPTGETYAMRILENEEALSGIDPGAKVRTTHLFRKVPADGRYYAFGVFDVSGNRIVKPEDPMAELLVIPGNPLNLASSCDREARFLELMSGGAFFLGLVCNLCLFLYVAGRLIY